MFVRILLLACLLAFPLACGGTPGGDDDATVRTVADGDTLVLTDGRRVRLVQLDAPELGAGECHGAQATRTLEALVPPGTEIRLQTDPALDQEDDFGRVLAYVFRGETNVNLELVRRGGAAPWFYDGDRGRYAPELIAAAREAQQKDRGLWRECPLTILDPQHPVETRP